MNENRRFFIRNLVGLMNNKFWNTVFESLLIRLCMTCRVDWSRTTQAVLAVQFMNGSELQLIFMSAAMFTRSMDSENFISDMTSYFPSNPFRTISCVISVMDVCTDCEFRLGWGCRFLLSSCARVVAAQRAKTAPCVRASVQLEFDQSCSVE